MIGWLLLLASVVLAIIVSPWIWIAVALLAIWKTYQLYFYFGRPWRRVHYPFMRVYARAAGLETGDAHREGREFDVRRALAHALHERMPGWDDGEIQLFINDAHERCTRGDDVALLQNELKRRYPRADDSQIENAIEAMRINIDPSDNSTIVRMIIAGLIEQQYGSNARGEYIYELIAGTAT